MIKRVWDRRFIAYLVAGGINTLFGYALYTGLVMLGVLPQLAVAIGGIAGTLFNFWTNSIVFQSRDARRLPRFVLVYAIMLVLNVVLLDIVMRIGLGPLLAQAAILPVFTLTFFALRRFVFAALPEQTA